MKNQEKITELKEYIDASGIDETTKALQELCGEYLHLEKMQEKRREIGLEILEILDAIWKLQDSLSSIIEKSKVWEKTERKSDMDSTCW